MEGGDRGRASIGHHGCCVLASDRALFLPALRKETRTERERERERDGGGGGIGDREESRVFVAGEERTGGKRGKERERQEEALSWRHVLRGRQSLLV